MVDIVEISLEEADGVRVARATGEIDGSVTGLLHDRLRPAPLEGASAFVLDLSDVTFVDSTGLQLLLNTADELRQRLGQQLHLVVRPGSHVRRLLATTRVDDMIPVHETLNEAVAAVRESAA